MADGETATGSLAPMDIRRILTLLPHRYPMLLVDRVESMVKDQSIHAVKAVTMTEHFLQGHFPARPIMPGVLIVEALPQAGGVLGIESIGLAGTGQLAYFMCIDGVQSSDERRYGDQWVMTGMDRWSQ